MDHQVASEGEVNRTMRKIGIGLIGCGGMGRGVAKETVQQDDSRLEVRAVCDPDENAVNLALQELNPKAAVYKDHRKLVRAKDVDWVMIASWNSAHARQAIAALDAGQGCVLPEAAGHHDEGLHRDAQRVAQERQEVHDRFHPSLFAALSQDQEPARCRRRSAGSSAWNSTRPSTSTTARSSWGDGDASSSTRGRTFSRNAATMSIWSTGWWEAGRCGWPPSAGWISSNRRTRITSSGSGRARQARKRTAGGRGFPS